eukprot:gene13032-27502_t
MLVLSFVNSEQCPSNEYIQSFTIVNPVNSSIVDEFVYIKVLATVYNVDKIMNIKDNIRLCHRLNEKNEVCDLNVFDEHLVSIKELGTNKISVTLCIGTYGCFCTTEAYVERLFQSNDLLTNHNGVENSIILDMIKWKNFHNNIRDNNKHDIKNDNYLSFNSTNRKNIHNHNRNEFHCHLSEKNAPKKRFYAGEVFSIRLNHTLSPQRHLSHINYLPESVYPLPHLPPFAAGNAFILSSDLVFYIARNIGNLRAVGSLED